MERKFKLLLILLFCAGIFAACSAEKPTNTITSSTTEKSDTSTADDVDFLEHFAGDWETDDKLMTLSFQYQDGKILLISQNLATDKEKTESILMLDGYDSSNNRWLLYTLADESFYYSVIEADEDMITVNSFVSRPETDGTSKAFDYYRVRP
ncbi:hypothetical protein JZO70_22020 [Enterococcus sp. 669A]|uniref:Lipocalin-like domain-containing protein n=1 Tax=Candidatus Enterococcus moelleringii TaxID=2815325 RepID=A0ABS3LGU0_9ENTE|nr:hypothetical protein [Enterococcus sp. 669A]MBO1308864.1 hypothetical protein [Enterococcus sp. 669A]